MNRMTPQFRLQLLLATILLACVAGPSLAQTVVATIPPSPPGWLIVVFVIVAVAGVWYAYQHNAKVKALIDALKHNTAATAGNTTAVATPVPTNGAPPPAVSPASVGAIQADLQAYIGRAMAAVRPAPAPAPAQVASVTYSPRPPAPQAASAPITAAPAPTQPAPASPAPAPASAPAAAAVGPTPPWIERFPKIVTIGGVNIMALAPINPGWLPSQNAWVFGHLPGTFVNDPSLPAGARSPTGYPMYNGQVLFGEQAFPDEQAVEVWKAAVVERDAGLAAWAASVDVAGKGFPVMSVEEQTATLAAFDACMSLGREDWAFYGLTATEHFALQNRGLTRADINRKINQYNGQAAPRDLAQSPRAH